LHKEKSKRKTSGENDLNRKLHNAMRPPPLDGCGLDSNWKLFILPCRRDDQGGSGRGALICVVRARRASGQVMWCEVGWRARVGGGALIGDTYIFGTGDGSHWGIAAVGEYLGTLKLLVGLC
jgi:hypothetical protein